MSWTCRDVRLALGVYVLGAIEVGERAEVDGHLAACAACREELAGLAGLPALLRRVPQAEAGRLVREGAADPDPGESMLPRLAARVAAAGRARSRRAAAAVAVAAALALGAGGAAGAMLAHGEGRAPAAAASSSPAPGGGPSSGWQTAAGAGAAKVALTVRYAPTAWGTDIRVQVGGLRPGTVCQFAVTDASGRRWIVGSWRVAGQAWSTWYPASTWLSDSQIRAFTLMSGHTVVARAVAR